MLEPLLGSTNAERVLIYIMTREQGYARAVARFFGADPDSIQKQLAKFELGGVLVSKSEGRTRLYRFNPRYSFLPELKGLLQKALAFYPQDEQERLLVTRQRPRRSGKPLGVGQEPVKQINRIETPTGVLRIISPTDCVKDRLTWYYHDGDMECLRQAVLVAGYNSIDIQEIRRWSCVEGMHEKFDLIKDQLQQGAIVVEQP